MPWVDWLLIIRAIWGMYKTAMASNSVLVCALEACTRERKTEGEHIRVDRDITGTIAQIAMPETHNGL